MPRVPFLSRTLELKTLQSQWESQRAKLMIVYGRRRVGKTLILGECKWNHHPMDVDVLQALVEKTAAVLPGEGNWRIFFLGFACCGWTQSALDYAAQAGRLQGERWKSVGMALLDLAQVDRDLLQWTP